MTRTAAPSFAGAGPGSRAALAAENRRYGRRFVDLELPASAPAHLLAAHRNRDWLVQLYAGPGLQRLSINRAALAANGRDWAAGITWDELMEVKTAAGYGDRWAVEVYPPADAVENVANMRHLWLLEGPPAFGWHSPAAPT